MQQIVLTEYVDAVQDAQRRVVALTGQIREAPPTLPMAPVVEALMALRGVSLVVAVTPMAGVECAWVVSGTPSKAERPARSWRT